jgi:hypothetical protein
MGFWNSISGIQNKWGALKSGISKIYEPVKKVVRGIKHGKDYVDHLLDKAVDFGVPSSIVDVVRGNPIYSGISDAINIADDLVEKDLPRIGAGVDKLVTGAMSRSPVETLKQAVGIGKDVINTGVTVARGFTPNRSASARQQVGAGSAR